jgi:hypothetical protein
MESTKIRGPQQGAALMKRSTKYVALDVHQATTVSSVRDTSGRVIARTILPTEASALVEYFPSMRGSIHVAFEEGTQAQWLPDLLARGCGAAACARYEAPRVSSSFHERQRQRSF